LLIALIIISAFTYVTHIISQTPVVKNVEYDHFLEYKQGLRNTIVSSLSNITNGGNVQVLNSNINKFNQIIRTQFYQTIIQINNTLPNDSHYQNGIWLSWSQENYGVSAAITEFTLNSTGISKSTSCKSEVKVISEVSLSGTYFPLNNTANLIVYVLNEGKPASARDFSLYYQNNSGWVQGELVNIIDSGDGMYRVSFITQLSQPSDTLIVSIKCEDQRGIIVGANTRCTSS
jgi:hypothetical protein